MLLFPLPSFLHFYIFLMFLNCLNYIPTWIIYFIRCTHESQLARDPFNLNFEYLYIVFGIFIDFVLFECCHVGTLASTSPT